MTDVRIEGLDTLTATMAKAADQLASLPDAPARAAAVIASAASAAAPRRSGRLAGSIRASRGSVDVTAAYAGPIEWGWPSRNVDATHFAMNAARATEPQWVKFYEDDVQKILDGVRGV